MMYTVGAAADQLRQLYCDLPHTCKLLMLLPALLPACLQDDCPSLRLGMAADMLAGAVGW